MNPNYPGFQPQTQPDGSTTYVPTHPAQQQQQYGGGFQPPPQQYATQPQQWQPQQQQPPQQPWQPPPQQYGAPPQQGYGQPPPQQYGAPPPQQYAPQQQGMQGPPMPPSGYPQNTPSMQGLAPTTYIPNEAEFAVMMASAEAQQAAIAAARAGGGGNRRNLELKFLGPNGEKDWKDVPVGFRRQLLFRVLPAGIQGQPYYFEAPKHFWKSNAHPRGMGGWCPGQAACSLCRAIEAGLASGVEAMIAKAKMARAKSHRLYQGMQYGAVDVHRDENGKVKPLIYDAPTDVHLDFTKFMAARGLHVFLDLERGAPFQITRKKEGPQPQNIGYEVIDMLKYAGPIPQEFGFGPRGEGLELWDLRKFAKVMTGEDQQKAIAECGFTTGQQYSYSPAASTPPNQSPFPQQQPPQQYGQQPQQQQPPQQWQPQQTLPSVGQQQQPPAQGSPWAGQQQGAPWGAQQSNPPAVLPSTGQAPSGSYQPPKPADPWANAQPQPNANEPPPGWQPPAPPPPAQNWGQQAPAPQAGATWAAPPPPAPSPEFAALQAQLTGHAPPPPVAQPSPQQAAGPGPSFPPPGGAFAAPPPR